MDNICTGNFNMKPDISPIACDLMTKMLNVNPNNRINLNDILNHPWITGESMIFPVHRVQSCNST